jgi:hypothetical protein
MIGLGLSLFQLAVNLRQRIIGPRLLQESGGGILLENGFSLLKE